jgi:23S rRNA (adenine2030-N6)-methyltransferase
MAGAVAAHAVNYRHAYHAGSFADVVKHVVLVAVLAALARKDKPFSALDLHAGIGAYDLTAEAARTGEYRDGIARIIDAVGAPPAVARYLDRVRAFDGTGQLARYPGSPLLIRAAMRAEDRLTLVELHAADADLLRTEFRGDGQVAIHRRDAWEAAKALLPPQPRRGLVLVDPSFEAPGEFARLARTVDLVGRRWPEGTGLHWYPIKDRAEVDAFLATAAGTAPDCMVVELTVFDDPYPARLNGCGMLIVRPPYGLEGPLAEALAWLQPRLARRGGQWRCEAVRPATADERKEKRR